MILGKKITSSYFNAEVAHLVEHDLAKVGVAGSSPVFRSKENFIPTLSGFFFKNCVTRVVELVDTPRLQSGFAVM